MQKFIGVKIVEAEPMAETDWLDSKGHPHDNKGRDGYKVRYRDGYESWCPLDAFEHNNIPVSNKTPVVSLAAFVEFQLQDAGIKLDEKFTELIANVEMGQMTIGHAIEALKNGYRVARLGWNGKGIVLRLADMARAKMRNNENFELQEHIVIDTNGLQTDNPHAPKSVVPWLASQTDMLAEDWYIVE